MMVLERSSVKAFKTSLLREKFVIENPDQGASVVALSNRMSVTLRNAEGDIQDSFVVRTQNMHSCARMANKIIASFINGGLTASYDWDKFWDLTENNYELNFNPQRWVAIYHKGKSVFKAGENIHPFLDLIERCDYENQDTYETSISLAEAAFKKTGKEFKIDYDGNVALVTELSEKEVKCSFVLRGPDKTTTFNFTAAHKTRETPDYLHCLEIAASFLEGMQLAFMAGMNQTKIRFFLIERHSDEEKKTKAAKKRLGKISTDITNLHNTHDVHYRPDRPELMKVINEAEKWAAKTFKPDPKSGYV